MDANKPKPFDTFDAAMHELARRREAEARKQVQGKPPGVRASRPLREISAVVLTREHTVVGRDLASGGAAECPARSNYLRVVPRVVALLISVPALGLEPLAAPGLPWPADLKDGASSPAFWNAFMASAPDIASTVFRSVTPPPAATARTAPAAAVSSGNSQIATKSYSPNVRYQLISFPPEASTSFLSAVDLSSGVATMPEIASRV